MKYSAPAARRTRTASAAASARPWVSLRRPRITEAPPLIALRLLPLQHDQHVVGRVGLGLERRRPLLLGALAEADLQSVAVQLVDRGARPLAFRQVDPLRLLVGVELEDPAGRLGPGLVGDRVLGDGPLQVFD